MDQDVDVEDHHGHGTVDELEIELDLDEAIVEAEALPAHEPYQDDGRDEFYSQDLGFDVSQVSHGKPAESSAPETENAAAVGHTDPQAASVHVSSALYPAVVNPRAESEIRYEEEDVADAEKTALPAGDQPLLGEGAHGNDEPGGDGAEDEITYDDDEELAGGADLPQGSLYPPPSEVADQQVFDDGNDGMAFDFEDAAHESTADDHPDAERDGSTENSEAQESLAEEMGMGSLGDLRPDNSNGNAEESYSSSSDSDGADVSHPGADGLTRPIVLVHYNGHDYDLFARSHDASPESYFLSQLDTLDYSLTQFLASLRSTLSGDVTEKERISFRIDSLGIEFGETTSRDFLDQKSFRMILSLYSGLVKNDSRPNTEPLYAHLVTHTDCAARFDELVEGVKKGFGLAAIASSASSAEHEYTFTANNPTNGDDDAGAEIEGHYDSSEHFSDDEDESAEDEAAANHGGSTTMSGAAVSPAGETGDGEDEDDEDEERDSYVDDDAPDDNFDAQLGDGRAQDQMAYDDVENAGIYGTNDAEEAALHGERPSVGAFVDEAGDQAVLDAEEYVEVQDGGFDEGGEEFVDYEEDLEGIATDQVVLANGNSPPSAMSQHAPTPVTGKVDDPDLIDYSDDETLAVNPKVILAQDSEWSRPSSPCERKARELAAAEDIDLIDYSDDEVASDVKAVSQASQRLVTSVTARPLRLDEEPRNPEGSVVERWNSSRITVSPPRGGRPIKTLTGSRRMGTSTAVGIGMRQGRRASQALQSSGLPLRNECASRTEAMPSTRARAIKTAAGVNSRSAQSSGSDFTFGSDFSLRLSKYTDADLLDHQGATTNDSNDFEHQDGRQTSGHGSEPEESLVSGSNVVEVPRGFNPGAFAQMTSETASHPTSATSTLHGDEIQVEPASLGAGDAINNGISQSSGLAVPQASIDEIDWEDHGEDEATFAADVTPSSASAKRGREANDAGSFVDETEAKRRRT